MNASPAFPLRPFLPHGAASDVVHSKGARAFPCACSGKPTRSLEGWEKAFADVAARVSLMRDQAALASSSFRLWAHQHHHKPNNAQFAPAASPNRSRTIADP